MHMLRLSGSLVFLLFVDAALAQVQRSPEPTLIGLEYAVVDNDRLTAGMAKVFGEAGLTSMKLLGEASQWGKMQRRASLPIDFTQTDRFVREYQQHGVGELIMALKSHSPWASVRQGWFGEQNPTPKPQYRDAYRNWVTAVVERYDADGVDDMPGLKRPVRYYEIGSEFSSYEPEPVAEYLQMLELAYRAAKSASAETIVTHAALLTTPVNLDVSDYRQLDRVWRDTPMNDRHHDIADIRAVLDRPELFDVINVHNLGDPYELEHIMRWLNWETTQRGYTRQVIVSDTTPTAYIAWGPATRCDRKPMGTMIPPATEADRCELAAYFSKLVDADQATLNATREFVAHDQVKRSIIAAEQGVAMINLSFTFDLPLLTSKFAQAGAGISGWGGAAKFAMHSGKVQALYPLYHAIKQLTGQLNGIDRVRRIPLPDQSVRLYELSGVESKKWVAWIDSGGVDIPGRPLAARSVNLPLSANQVRVVKVALGDAPSLPTLAGARGKGVTVGLGTDPIYLVPGGLRLRATANQDR